MGLAPGIQELLSVSAQAFDGILKGRRAVGVFLRGALAAFAVIAAHTFTVLLMLQLYCLLLWLFLIENWFFWNRSCQ